MFDRASQTARLHSSSAPISSALPVRKLSAIPQI